VGLLQAGKVTVGKGELDDPPAVGAQPIQMLALMLQSAAGEHLQLGILPLGPFQLAPGGGQLQLGEVFTLQEASQVSRAHDQPAV